MEIERIISSKGQVVLPRDIRRKLGLKPGSEITFELESDKIIIKKKKNVKESIEEFANIPKKVAGLTAAKIKAILEEQYEVR